MRNDSQCGYTAKLEADIITKKREKILTTKKKKFGEKMSVHYNMWIVKRQVSDHVFQMIQFMLCHLLAFR